jgi:hypothetical protein
MIIWIDGAFGSGRTTQVEADAVLAGLVSA